MNSNYITPTDPLISLDSNLVNLVPGNGSDYNYANFFRTDGNTFTSAIFKWGPPSDEWMGGFRTHIQGDGEFIHITGHPYRYGLSASYHNYDYIIENWLGGPLNIDEETKGNQIPVKYKLFQNYPNPFNPETTIKFGIPKTSKITLTIYNILGQEIKKFENNYKPGYHEIHWDGLNQNNKMVASGIYIYQIKSEKFTDFKKCLFLK